MKTIDTYESGVRSYVRSFPTVFTTAKGHELISEDGTTYIDFFAGAGALNYGHNDERMKHNLIEYLSGDGVVHSLDMATRAKITFIERFQETILAPRNMSYRFLFPGPTGTNAVEAALKAARKAKGRTMVYAFQGGFHGMTLGALAITSNEMKRKGAGQPLVNTLLLPFDGDTEGGKPSIDVLRERLELDAQQDSLPAAVILETIQCEGGVRVASTEWLQSVQELCKEHGVLLIIDDIQAGCGRSGRFFSFEEAGLDPDMICLSKSLSGMGLPFALLLLREELDVFQPGEHNGTFRGHNPAFVTAATALDYWRDEGFAKNVREKGEHLHARLETIAERHDEIELVRGRGMVQGLLMSVPGLPDAIAAQCFERGLIIETAGHDDEVLKFLPSLTMPTEALDRGLDIVEQSVQAAIEALSVSSTTND